MSLRGGETGHGLDPGPHPEGPADAHQVFVNGAGRQAETVRDRRRTQAPARQGEALALAIREAIETGIRIP